MIYKKETFLFGNLIVNCCMSSELLDKQIGDNNINDFISQSNYTRIQV